MKFDLHIHTTASPDSILEPEELFRIAKERGLDGVAVTNHNVLQNVKSENGIYVIPGCEVSTDAGHMLVFFLKSDICSELSKNEKGVYSYREVIEKAHGEGAVVFAAHPYSPVVAREEGIWDELDGVEVFNSRIVHSKEFFANEKAALLCVDKGLAFSVGSDAHSPDEVGVAFWESSLTRADMENEDFEERLKAELLFGSGKAYGGYAPRSAVYNCRRKTYIKRKMPKKFIKSYFICAFLWLRDIIKGKKNSGYIELR